MLTSRQKLLFNNWFKTRIVLPWRGPLPRGRALGTVAKPSLVDTSVNWYGVTGAIGYLVVVYKDAVEEHSVGVGAAVRTFDMAGVLDAAGDYTATIQAVADGSKFVSGGASEPSDAYTHTVE